MPPCSFPVRPAPLAGTHRVAEHPLRSSGIQLGLFVSLFFRAIALPDQRSQWQDELAAYQYTLYTADNWELIAFHWHPRGRGPIDFPYLDVGHDRESAAGPLAQAHIPTGAVPLSDVLRMAIAGLGVRPRHRDWARVFDMARRLTL